MFSPLENAMKDFRVENIVISILSITIVNHIFFQNHPSVTIKAAQSIVSASLQYVRKSSRTKQNKTRPTILHDLNIGKVLPI